MLEEITTRLREHLVENKNLIVLEGTHSSGKSVLGRKLAAALDLPFVDEIARNVFRRYGCDARYAGRTVTEIATIQMDILDGHHDAIHFADQAKIIDRGPVSVYAYTLARLAGVEDLVSVELEHARTFTEEHGRQYPHAHYILVPPNIPFERDGVREPGPFKRQQIHYLIAGMLDTYGYQPLRLVGDTPEARFQEAICGMCSRLRDSGLDLPEAQWSFVYGTMFDAWDRFETKKSEVRV